VFAHSPRSITTRPPHLASTRGEGLSSFTRLAKGEGERLQFPVVHCVPGEAVRQGGHRPSNVNDDFRSSRNEDGELVISVGQLDERRFGARSGLNSRHDVYEVELRPEEVSVVINLDIDSGASIALIHPGRLGVSGSL